MEEAKQRAEEEAKAKMAEEAKLKDVEEESEKRMVNSIGIQEETLKKIVLRKYTHHLRLQQFNRTDQVLLNSHKCEHEKPPFLYTSNIELKHHLRPLAEESDLDRLSGLLGSDGGG